MKPWTPSTSSNRFNWGYCLTSRVREAFGCKTNGYEVNQFLTPINPLRRKQTSRGAPRIHWIANQIELRTELKRSGGFEFTQQGVVACAQLGVDLLQGGSDVRRTGRWNGDRDCRGIALGVHDIGCLRLPCEAWSDAQVAQFRIAKTAQASHPAGQVAK